MRWMRLDDLAKGSNLGVDGFGRASEVLSSWGVEQLIS